MNEEDLEIVDAQFHEPETPRPIEGHDPAVRTLVDVEIAREAMDAVGVDAALVVAEQPYMDACVDRYPDRFGGVVTLDYRMGDLRGLIQGYRERPGMLAGRILVATAATTEVKAEFAEGLYDDAIRWAAQYQLPLFFSTHGWAHLIEPIAQRHPELTIVIDHLGVSQSPVSPPREQPWDQLPGLLALARYPNVHVKLCGVPLLSREAYPYRDAWPHLHEVINAFSPDRLMWASDFTRMRWVPVTSDLAPRRNWKVYSDCLNYLRDTDELGSAEKRKLLGATVRRVLRWDRPTVSI